MLSINRINDGKLLTNQKDILNEVKNFHANLYADNPQEMDSCGRINTTPSNGAQKTHKQKEMLWKISKTVSPQNKQVCEEPLTIQEIKKAISTLENNKSPGNDGLTGEFYKAFAYILQDDLLQLYSEISEKGRMSESMRQAVITCIYKKR